MNHDPQLMSKLVSARLCATQHALYFAHALQSLIPVFCPTGSLPFPTMACTEDYVLLCDESFIRETDVKTLASALIHEVSHLLRLHIRRTGDRDKMIANLAQDLEINDDLSPMGLPVPDSWMTPAKFRLEEGKSFEWYYENLLSKAKPKSGGVGAGKCGGCAGNPHEGEGDLVPDGTPRRTKTEVQQIAAAVAHEVRQAVKNRGNVPAGIARWAESHGAPPEVPWQEHLTRACRRAVAYRQGAVDYRYHRPSRRQAGLGFGPGKAVMPAMIVPVPQVAVMFDTSGSMGSAELKAAATETAGVLKAINARVRFCVVDAQVHALQDVGTIEQAMRLLKGGGGTCFVDAFRQLEESRPTPEVIVVMTDGAARVPDVAPAARVIWCLIGTGAQPPCEWGDAVYVKGATS